MPHVIIILITIASKTEDNELRINLGNVWQKILEQYNL